MTGVPRLDRSTPPLACIIDVDGVMTDGGFFYGAAGKIAKRFGADDHDALTLLKPHVPVIFVTGDHRGFPISTRRIGEDMNFPIELVGPAGRIEWIATRWAPEKVIYIGDGIFDGPVFPRVGYGITVADALEPTIAQADYVTRRRGGERAVAEAALHLLARFFTPFGPQPAPARLDQARAYIDNFAARRIDRIGAMLAEDVTLSDWTTQLRGKHAVIAFCRDLFASGSIAVTTLDLHDTGTSVIARLVIAVAGNPATHIVDILDFDGHGKISAVTAFLGAASG